jgi:hypothetical protein
MVTRTTRSRIPVLRTILQLIYPPVAFESPPILLELHRKAGHSMLGTSGMHAYKSPGIPPAAQSTWNECKEKALWMFSDAGCSPLDLILNILDPNQHEYENYCLRWFSSQYLNVLYLQM